jgi:hypothetical protein
MTRDETFAIESGWTLDKIKRTRGSDLPQPSIEKLSKRENQIIDFSHCFPPAKIKTDDFDVQKKQLQFQLAELEKKQQNTIGKPFNIREVCKTSDAPRLIGVYIQDIMSECKKPLDNWSKKTDLLKFDDFDDDEMDIIRKSIVKDKITLQKSYKKLETIGAQLSAIIQKKVAVVEILENIHEDEQNIGIKMREKLQKLQHVSADISQKLLKMETVFSSE